MRTSKSGTRSTIQNPDRSLHQKASASRETTTTTCVRISGISFSRCERENLFGRTRCSGTMLRSHATWQMNRITGTDRCIGTRRRRRSSHRKSWPQDAERNGTPMKIGKTALVMIAGTALVAMAFRSGAPARAADSAKEYLGRWDITMESGDGHKYPSWIEIREDGRQLKADYGGHWGNLRAQTIFKF